MAFMQPVAEYFTMYHVDTNHGTEYVPQELVSLDLDASLDDITEANEAILKALEPYIEGSEVYEIAEFTGWYARLSAPGYLDCTEWVGPYATAKGALDAVKEEYECDDEGDFDDGDGPDMVSPEPVTDSEDSEAPITRREGK